MKTVGLATLSLAIIVSSGLATSKLTNRNKEKVVSQVLTSSSERFVPIPVLTGQSYPILSAQAALAIDLDSGIALYEKDPDKLLLPASTTKIVTALVAMDYYSPDEILSVPNIKSEGQRMRLVFGEKLSVDALLKGLLISSANDAAEVLASEYPGGREAFISAMNVKAKQLNLDNTEFKNPSGLEAVGHVSTARDLIRVSEIAMENPYFAEIVGIKETRVVSVDGKFEHKLTNINELLGSVDGVLGVKTGWTENARENLVTYVERDGRRIMIALLGSQDRFGETKELIEWIFENYKWEEVSYP